MPEKEPQVTFTDRRKISADGEIRPEAVAEEEANRRQAEQREAAASAAQSAAPAQAATPSQSTAPAQRSAVVTEFPGKPAPGVASGDAEAPEENLPEGPTAQETAESHAAYQQTTRQLDELMRAKGPDGNHLGPVAFDHLVQSMYMTAMMGLGAGTQPGEKPRIDLMGARQTIDLLAVVQEKTKGNLTSDEERLLESALFELRMMFLEITNAIARNAANPGQPPPPGRK
ncbi:MAG: DUF1844 domain-containing protein [Acidobacteriaceae bacterium]